MQTVLCQLCDQKSYYPKNLLGNDQVHEREHHKCYVQVDLHCVQRATWSDLSTSHTAHLFVASHNRTVCLYFYITCERRYCLHHGIYLDVSYVQELMCANVSSHLSQQVTIAPVLGQQHISQKRTSPTSKALFSANLHVSTYLLAISNRLAALRRRRAIIEYQQSRSAS